MHDITFAQEAISILKQKIARDSVSSRIIVNACLSTFSHVTPDRLKEIFKELCIAEGFSGIILNIKPLEFTFSCKGCKSVIKIAEPMICCPCCGSVEFDINKGREFFVESIDID